MMIRTGYSFRTAIGNINSVLDRLCAIGYPAAPICDRNSTFGFNKWTKAAKKKNIRPVYGVELACVPELGAKRPIIDYWSFLAIDSLFPLHQLIYQATSNPGKEPQLTYDQALQAPGLFRISGNRTQLNHLQDGADLFISLRPSTPKGLYTEAQRRGFAFVACSDNYYPTATDRELYRVALGRRADTQSYPQHILSDDEWRNAVSWFATDTEHPLDLAKQLLTQCSATLQRATLLKPKIEKTLRQLCEEGAKRTNTDLSNPVYRERLEKELKLIEDKQFADYFYILADMINFAKQHMIVGPARGSSCGSLVCYLLNITAINPIPFDLIFERFIDITRSDLPDIDVDFSDERRHLVFEYAEQKYGIQHVARLGTVGLFRPRSALNQVGTALQIPKWKIEALADTIIERSGGDARALQTLEDTLNDTEKGRDFQNEFPEAMIIASMEGEPTHASQHAAGIVLTQDPIINYVAIDGRSKSVMCDKKDAEDLNLLKIDALGLTQLSIFERTLELIGKPTRAGFLESLPLDDKAAFDVLNQKQFAGIFQFNGAALQSVTNQITVNHIEDIISITAVARPGPAASGGTSTWTRRHSGKEPISTLHPMLTELTRSTFGVVIYQETVMKIVREMGGLSWEDTSAVRKAMSGRLGDEFFEQFWQKFRAGAIANGVPEDMAHEIWRQINTMGSWAFNRCICGTTKVKLAHVGSNLKGNATIAQLYRRYEKNKSNWIRQRNSKPWLVSLYDRGRPQMAAHIMQSGKKICWRYKFNDGSSVTCTPEHRFLINGKWQPIGNAKRGAEFTSLISEPQQPKVNGRGKGHASGKRYFRARSGFAKGAENIAWTNGTSVCKKAFRSIMQYRLCEDCGNFKSRMEVHHNDFNNGTERPWDLTWLCAGCHKKRHYQHDRQRRWGKGLAKSIKIFKSKKRIGLRMTYDIEMPGQHNFMLANGLITHNSHAVAYGIVSYWCCWLKAHHPVEFAAATLDAEKEPARQIALLRELKAEGVDYIPFDPQLSTARWEPAQGPDGKRILIGPLTAVKGIGPAIMQEIIDARKSGEPLRDAITKKLENATTEIDSLFPIADAVKRFVPSFNGAVITPCGEAKQDMPGDIIIVGLAERIAPLDMNEEIRVQRRGGKIMRGPTAALNLFMMDDSGKLLCRVDRYLYDTIGRPIVNHGRPGKVLYAVKGRMLENFPMMIVKQVKHLGDLDDVSLSTVTARTRYTQTDDPNTFPREVPQ